MKSQIFRLTLPLTLILEAGCASTTMTAYEREIVREDTYQEWQMCRKMYKQSDNAYWLSQGTKRRVKRGNLQMPHTTDMRRDLLANRCSSLMKSNL